MGFRFTDEKANLTDQVFHDFSVTKPRPLVGVRIKVHDLILGHPLLEARSACGGKSTDVYRVSEGEFQVNISVEGQWMPFVVKIFCNKK